MTRREQLASKAAREQGKKAAKAVGAAAEHPGEKDDEGETRGGARSNPKTSKKPKTKGKAKGKASRASTVPAEDRATSPEAAADVGMNDAAAELKPKKRKAQVIESANPRQKLMKNERATKDDKASDSVGKKEKEQAPENGESTDLPTKKENVKPGKRSPKTKEAANGKPADPSNDKKKEKPPTRSPKQLDEPKNSNGKSTDPSDDKMIEKPPKRSPKQGVAPKNSDGKSFDPSPDLDEKISKRSPKAAGLGKELEAFIKDKRRGAGSTFARRYQPEKGLSAARWEAIRHAFIEYVQPKIVAPSKQEDLS